MAIIKKFDLSEIDYESVIARKYESGNYEDCIKTIRYVLDESDVEIDIVVAGIFLIKSYYNLALYEEAFYEIKLLLAVGVSNSELSVLAMECIAKLGRLTTHKYFNYTNFDFINDNFDDDSEDDQEASNMTIANSTEDDVLYRKQIISTKIMEGLEDRNTQRSEKGFLSVVDKEESDGRLYLKFHDFLVEEKFDEAIALMSCALKKEPNNIKYIEHFLLACDRSGHDKLSVELAKHLMDIAPLSALGAHSYVDACYKCGEQPDWAYVNRFASEFKTENEFDLYLILQTVLCYRENIDLALRVLDNHANLSVSFFALFVRAFIATRREEKVAAVEIFKRMRAIFGRRCFADEYIELVKSGKLNLLHACQMPKESVLKSIVKLDLTLRDENTKISEVIACTPSYFEDVKRVLYSDEVDFARRTLAKLDKKAVISVMWQLQELLLDDQHVLPSIKQIILFTLLSKLPTTVFLLGCNDVVEDVDAEEFIEATGGDKAMQRAIVIALSKLYFKEATMSIRFKSAAQHVKEFKDKSGLDNAKYLAELILVDCWYYGLEFTAETIALECELKVKTLAKYLTDYNNYSGKHKFPSMDDDMSDVISVEGDLDEILGDFASFIEKITNELVVDKPTLRVIKRNNVKIDENNNGNTKDDNDGHDENDDK